MRTQHFRLYYEYKYTYAYLIEYFNYVYKTILKLCLLNKFCTEISHFFIKNNVITDIIKIKKISIHEMLCIIIFCINYQRHSNVAIFFVRHYITFKFIF